MKKLISLMLVLVMTLSLFAACGKGGDKKDGGESNSNGGSESSDSASESGVIKGDGGEGDISYAIDASLASSATPVDVGSLYTSDSMIDAGIQRPGNVQRLASALYRASNGEPIKLAFIGGDATQGQGASSPEKAYAELVRKWWDETFPKTDVTIINLGLAGQDSYIADHRVAKELIPEKPDVVFIETALYENQALVEESFECLARQLLSCESQPAIVPIVLTNSSLSDFSQAQSALAFKMDLPVINFGAVVKSNINGNIWKWTDIADENTGDLNDAGHAFLARLVTEYCNRVLKGMEGSTYKEYVLTDQTSSKCRYMNASFLRAEDFSATGFIADGIDNSPLAGISNGYSTHDGTAGEFTITGSNIGLVWYKTIDGNGGTFDVYVDGTKVKEKLAGSNVAVGEELTEEELAKAYPEIDKTELGKFDNGPHTIRIEKSEDSKGDGFFIIGFTVSQ